MGEAPPWRLLTQHGRAALAAAAAAAARMSGALARWQSASARASAMSGGEGFSGMSSRTCTIRCTWSLPALPHPVTACLTSLGLYWTTGMPASAAVARAKPLAWPTDIAVRALVWKSTRSTTTTSGESLAKSSRNSRNSSARRSARGFDVGVVSTPDTTATGFPFS